jgi:hypothetical protein
METLVEKDLGIMVTGDLQWDRHIVKLCSSVNFYAKLVFKGFDFKSVNIIRFYWLVSNKINQHYL